VNKGLAAATLRLAGMGGRFLLLLLIGRFLTPEDMGAFGLFAATCLILVQMIGLELHQPAVREVLKRSGPLREGVVRAQLRAYKFAYLLLPIALLIACRMGAVAPGKVLLLGLVIIGSHVSMEAHRLLMAVQRTGKAYIVLSLAQGLWVYPVALLLALFPSLRSLTTIMVAWAFAAGAAATIGWREIHSANLLSIDSRRSPDLDFLRNARSSAATFMVSSTAFLLIESIDRYFLQHYYGGADVGVYTLYASIARALREIAFAAIVSLGMPRLVAAAQRQEQGVARREISRLSKRLALFVLAGAPALALGLLAILPLLNDARYGTGISAYVVLLASAAIGTLAMVPHYTLYAYGHDRTLLAIHLVTLIVAVGAYSVLVRPYGIHGAAAASLLTSMCMFVLKASFARRILPRKVTA
jgi:O-antigen/teichoic acid export membrane protein